MIRHLLYSVYAAAHTDEWFLNIKELCKYKHVFNGRRVVVIRSDENTVLPETVEEAFSIYGFYPIEFVHVRNNADLCEVYHFIELLGRFNTNSNDEILFYAHTKGVSYNKNFKNLVKIRNWRNLMYQENLTYIDEVEKALKTHPCAGIFRLDALLQKAPVSKWHYSGTFWWVNLKKLFSHKQWRHITQNRFGVEAYLGGLFQYREAYCLAYDTQTPWKNVTFYNPKLNSPVPSISIILPTVGSEFLKRVVQQVYSQLGENDELLICGDGACEQAQCFVHLIDDLRVKYLEHEPGPSGNCGHTVRNWAMPQATKSHIYFIDDDDELLENGLQAIRTGIEQDPYKIQVFQIHQQGGIIWKEQEVFLGNVSTQMIVVPNIKSRLGIWKERTAGDLEFLKSTVDLHPKKENGIAWRNKIIATHGISIRNPLPEKKLNYRQAKLPRSPELKRPEKKPNYRQAKLPKSSGLKRPKPSSTIQRNRIDPNAGVIRQRAARRAKQNGKN